MECLLRFTKEFSSIFSEFVVAQGMYPFMFKHLGLDGAGVRDPETELFDESGTTLETPERMRVFDDASALREHALGAGSRVEF